MRILRPARARLQLFAVPLAALADNQEKPAAHYVIAQQCARVISKVGRRRDAPVVSHKDRPFAYFVRKSADEDCINIPWERFIPSRVQSPD